MITVLIINKYSYTNIIEFKISTNMININNIDKILNNNNETSKLHTWEYETVNISLYGISNNYNDFNINLYNFPEPIDKVYGNCMLIAYNNINNNYIDLTINYYTEFVKKLFNISANNSLITPSYDTDFSISFDDNKIDLNSLSENKINNETNSENINIEVEVDLDYNNNDDNDNDIINVSDLTLTDDDDDDDNINDNTFELTFSDDDDNNNNKNNTNNTIDDIKII